MSDLSGRLVDLVDYVTHLHRLTERTVTRLQDYRNLLFHEVDLKDRIGIHHNPADEDDVWLRLDRLIRRDPPPPPREIQEWVAVSRDPDQPVRVDEEPKIRTVTRDELDRLLGHSRVRPEDIAPAVKESADGIERFDVIVRLEDQPALKQAVDDYIAGPWQRWAEAERPRRRAILIYEAFFALQQAIEAAGDESRVELVWGIGLARWHRPPYSIDHCLIEQLVEIDVDPTSAALRIRPRSIDPSLYLKPFQAEDNPGVDVVLRSWRRHVDGLGDTELSPFVPQSFEPILRQAATQLDAGAVYHPDVRTDHTDRTPPEPSERLTVDDTWVIYARPRSDNFLIEDLAHLKNAIEVAAGTGNLPAGALRLVTMPADEDGEKIVLPPIVGGIEKPKGGTHDGAGAKPIDEQFLLPKPYNDAQIQIVHRLECEDGVIVQGPPGTGKTHTIANIICHYLATGRRVLVTAHTEAALTVLRDQIPEDIRELAISLLTSEREGLRQLERAVTILATDAARQDGRPLLHDIQEDERQILTLRSELLAIDRELADWAAKHLQPVQCDGQENRAFLAMPIAEEVAKGRDRHGWFVDRPLPGEIQAADIADEEIEALRAARIMVGTGLGYLGITLPALGELPDAAMLTAIHEDLVEAKRLGRDASTAGTPVLALTADNAMERAEELLAALNRVIAYHEARREDPWLHGIVARWRQRSESWRAEPIDELISTIGEVAAERRELLGRAVSMPEAAVASPAVVEALRRRIKGRWPFGPFAVGRASSQAKALYGKIRVGGMAPQSAWDAKVALDYIEWRRRVTRMVAQWNALARDYELPELADDGDQTGHWASVTMERIDLAREVVRLQAELLERETPVLFPQAQWQDTVLVDPTAARKAADAIRINLARQRLEGSRQRLVRLKEQLAQGGGEIVAQMRDFVATAVGEPGHTTAAVAETWRDLCARLARLHDLQPQFQTISRVCTKLATAGAPAWAARLRHKPADDDTDPLLPADWRQAWRWAQLEGYLRSIDGRERIAALSERRTAVETELRRRFGRVVRLRTYAGLKNRMTDRVLAALQMFLTALQGIGAGTGVRARRFRRDARQAMERCYAAVPCWIMPHWRVSESLPADLASFDLVIVDEASQSDITALPVLLRGKKVLVVGDNKQVSPLAIGIEEREILRLRRHYLQEQPFQPLLLPGGSLYDLMSAVYPRHQIMLNEHFRCVEPIIRFSFQFYTETIAPLRLPKASERLDPPLIDILVWDGEKRGRINRREAEVIVDEIATIVDDPGMAGRSIGVVSLIGREQAALVQRLLLERIGEDRYLRHQITCGDAATFQGKERDIMLISMVASPGRARAQTSRLFQQRFNVALSRARDRMYLVRSVEFEMLNPNDLKARVIEHFRNPMGDAPSKENDLIALCESDFERAVFQRLTSRGYRAWPQVRVGGFRIDIVVEGADDRRLAIELDGDGWHGPERWAADFKRQRTLERMGWRFWRCWGSSFALDPDGCMDDLFATLDELGIEPLGDAGTAARYTEHRVVGRAPGIPAEAEPEPVSPAAEPTDASAPAPAISPEPFAAPSTVSQRLADVDAPTAERVITVGDRVVIAFDNDGRQRMVTITPDRNDPALGVIRADHPLALALLGNGEEDEVEIEAGGTRKRATILRIEKAA